MEGQHTLQATKHANASSQHAAPQGHRGSGKKFVAWQGGGGGQFLRGVAKRGSFGRAFVNFLCLLVVCLQPVTQGLVMLGIAFCLDRCHSNFCPPEIASRFFGLKWLRKALCGQSQRAFPWKGAFFGSLSEQPLPRGGGGGWKSPPPPNIYSPHPSPANW